MQVRYENEIAILELDDGKANALGHDAISSLVEKLDEVQDAGESCCQADRKNFQQVLTSLS